MQIMCVDKPVAVAVYDDTHSVIQGFRVLDGVNDNDLPFELFGLAPTRREVSYLEFLNWVEERCLPRNQIGMAKTLKHYNMSEYDPLEFARKTGLHAGWKDNFWIKFEEDEL